MSENENVIPLTPESGSETGEASNTPLETFIQHQRRALDEATKAIDALLPDGFKTHSSEAGKEFVKGFKVLADALITEIEKMTSEAENAPGEDDKPSTTGKTKVKVEVE